MIKEDGTFGRKYEHVIDRDTGEYVILKNTHRGVIQQDAVFYDPERHIHLTPDCCAVPNMDVIAGYHQAGGKKVAQHFKVAYGQSHSPNCPNTPKPQEEDHTERDKTKGPVIFLNGSLSDFARDFEKAASRSNKERLVYRNEQNKWVIRDEDLESRPRLHAANPEDLFALMKRKDMTQTCLSDTKILFDDSVTPWDKFFVRGRRLVSFVQDVLDAEKQPHPILLHIRMKEEAEYQFEKRRLKIRLPEFSIDDPETGKPVQVHPYVYVRNPFIFNEFRNFEEGEEREFFLLTPAYTSNKPGRNKGPNLRYVSDEEAARPDPLSPENLYVHFELKTHLYARKTLAELNAEMQQKPDFMVRTPANRNAEPV
jgi:hypothetical protein